MTLYPGSKPVICGCPHTLKTFINPHPAFEVMAAPPPLQPGMKEGAEGTGHRRGPGFPPNPGPRQESDWSRPSLLWAADLHACHVKSQPAFPERETDPCGVRSGDSLDWNGAAPRPSRPPPAP